LRDTIEPLRENMCQLLATMLHNYHKYDRKMSFILKIIQDFGEADLQKNKLIYSLFCQKAVKIFSRKLFTDYLISILLRFPYDKRPVVRKEFLLKVAPMLNEEIAPLYPNHLQEVLEMV